MNILIPNSWLKDYLETNAMPEQFAEAMSLTSVSIERIEKVENDAIFDIEVTTNRPDLMSIEGIAREASAVLPQAGYKAVFKSHRVKNGHQVVSTSPMLKIENDATLVNRILAVVMEIDLGKSPEIISSRLEKTGIRSINNVVDVTNYIMREIGHPSHVFDYDRLLNHTLIIRKSKKGEKLQTLDEKDYELPGNDIVADNGTGEIIDLLGIMGTNNSVVTDNTKRIVLFLDNNNPHLLRKTSMNLGIRTEAAVLNEKGVDPELMMPTLLRGIELLKQNASGKVVSDIIDIYPNKPITKKVTVTKELINSKIGITIPDKTVTSILENLGFEVEDKKTEITVKIPTIRNNDVEIPEDIVEEVARVYGYHKLPNVLPIFTEQAYYHQDLDEFYWTQKVKDAFKFWGYNEIYTYSIVAEELFEGPIENAVTLKNPLTIEGVYMRNTLLPSILRIIDENKNREELKLFEIANIYHKKSHGLPDEKLSLAGVIKHEGVTFYEAKGVIEQVANILGIKNIAFVKKDDGILGANIKLNDNLIGRIELEDDEATFEVNFEELLKNTSSGKNYIKPSKFPPAIEDVRVELASGFTFKKIFDAIKSADERVKDVILLDVYENKKTFRIIYLDKTRNLTSEDITQLREKVNKILEDKFKAKIG